MNLTYADVQEILRLLDASSFDELEIETDRLRLRLRRSASDGWTEERQTLAQEQPAPLAAAPFAESSPAAATAPIAQTAGNVREVRPPIIGTFYRAPQPGAAPFVQVGSKVAADTVVGIVETMKLMNSVYAGAAGEVIEICAADGQFVEAEQVLLRLRADGA